MKSEKDDLDRILPTDDTDSSPDIPPGVARRAFMMRSAMAGGVAVITGGSPAPQQSAGSPAAAPPPPTPAAPPLSADLDVVKRSKGPVMTVLNEFYKVGPGPSSSHTIGPMRITYDFYQ